MEPLLGLLKQAAIATATILRLAPTTPPPKAAEWGTCVAAAATRARVNPSVIMAVIQHESQWRPEVVSVTNDYGLGQIHCPSAWCSRKPTAAQRSELLNPCSNIAMVAEFLKTRGLQAYNPGRPRYAATIRGMVAGMDRAVAQR